MGLVGPLRTLWRLRIVVAIIGVIAIAMGTFVAYSYSPPTSLMSRQYTVAAGTAMALVDSPSSQVVDLGGEEEVGADISSLSTRATLLASLMTSSPMKEEIAASAGIPPNRLIAISPAVADPVPGTPSAMPDTSGRGIFVLKATIPTLESGQVPIISVSTQASEPEQATRLADAAFKVLNKNLDSAAVTDQVPNSRRITVRTLGPAHAEVQTRGPGKFVAAIVAFVLFGAGCVTILLAGALARSWRAASEMERMAPQPVAVDGYVNGHVNRNGNGTGHRAPQPAVVRTPAAVPAKLAPRVPTPPVDGEPKRNWASG